MTPGAARGWGVVLACQLACAAGPPPASVAVSPPPSPSPSAQNAPAWPDGDGDGVDDGRDGCPEQPEDKDAFEDDDGCPDLDNDHDRLPDARDQCPNEPETYNSLQDEDGCPERGVVSFGFGFGIMDTIPFRDAASALPPEAIAVLDRVASTIGQHPEAGSIEVQGYADAHERRPETLAAARAAAVRAALISRGVAGERLRPRGYGTSRLHCSEDYESCARQNRRVEFGVVSPEATAVAPRRPRLVVFDTLYFPRSKSAAPRYALPVLQTIAADIQQHPEYPTFEVQGHADVAERRVDQLARGRADAVRAALISRGVAPERLVARGYGTSKPTCAQASEACAGLNRRVEFAIIKAPE